MSYVLINDEFIDKSTNFDSDAIKDCIINLSKNKKYKSVSHVLETTKDVLEAFGNDVKEDKSRFIFMIKDADILDYLSTRDGLHGYTVVKLDLPLYTVEPGKVSVHEH